MQVIEVAIGPGGSPGTFIVEVVSSPAGEAVETVVDDMGSVFEQLDRLQDAVLASALSTRRVLGTTEVPVRDAGRRLFSVLLGSGRVAGVYRASCALAASRGEGLRLVVRVDDPSLASLPWEAMFDEAIGEYVCREDPLVRRIPVSRVPPPLGVEPPLRILGIASSPRGLPRLDVEKEHEQLAHALARPIAAGLIELQWAPAATWSVLQEMLLEDREAWHAVHFIGHGDYDAQSDTGVIALEDDDGRMNLVEARQFVSLLRQARPMPRLVVLNSCSGGAAGKADLFSGTAAALVRGGVTAVAAMQFAISDPAAIAFTHGFYVAIAKNRGVDDAVSSGRTAIVGLGTQTLEWITPVLYLRGDEARVFDVTGPVQVVPPVPASPTPLPLVEVESIGESAVPPRSLESGPQLPDGATLPQDGGREDLPPGDGTLDPVHDRRRWFHVFTRHPVRTTLLGVVVLASFLIAAALVPRVTPPGPPPTFVEERRISTVGAPVDVKTDSNVLLVIQDSGLLQRIDPASSQVTENADFAARPGAGLLKSSDDLAVPLTDSSSIGFVNSGFTAKEVVAISGGHPQNGAVVSGDLWFSCQTDTGGFLIHLHGRREVGRLPMPHKPFGLAARDDALYVTFTDDDAIAKVDVNTNSVTKTGSVSSHPIDVAIVNGDVWTTLSGSNEVAVLDPGTLTVKSRHPVGVQPWKIVEGLDSVWVTNTNTASPSQGTVSRLDPKTGLRQQPDIHVGGRPDALAVGDDAVYVANITDKTISVLRTS